MSGRKGLWGGKEVQQAVQYLKGKNSYKLLSEFSSLKKRRWGQHLWARGCWVAFSGNVTNEAWKEYIKNQKPTGGIFTSIEPDSIDTKIMRLE